MGLEESRAAQVPSRIIIADDHPLFRSAIRQALEEHPDLEMVAEVADGQEALELCRRLEPELVLMDLRMPHMDGIPAARAIKRELPTTLVLILTAIDESRGLSDSLEAGAAGYILKDAPAFQITHAVRRVLSGGSALDDELAMRPPPRRPRPRWARREAPVILTVDAAALHAASHAFYQAANGVWLTDHVPPGDLSGWPG